MITTTNYKRKMFDLRNFNLFCIICLCLFQLFRLQLYSVDTFLKCKQQISRIVKVGVIIYQKSISSSISQLKTFWTPKTFHKHFHLFPIISKIAVRMPRKLWSFTICPLFQGRFIFISCDPPHFPIHLHNATSISISILNWTSIDQWCVTVCFSHGIFTNTRCPTKVYT